MILNVDRSTPEHAVHSTGSMGGGGQRGTGRGGPTAYWVIRTRPNPYLYPNTGRVGRGLNLDILYDT